MISSNTHVCVLSHLFSVSTLDSTMTLNSSHNQSVQPYMEILDLFQRETECDILKVALMVGFFISLYIEEIPNCKVMRPSALILLLAHYNIPHTFGTIQRSCSSP